MSDANAGTGHGERAYIGSFTSAGGHGVLTASVGREDGALDVLHRTGTALADPSYLAPHPSRPFLYAVSETAEGAVAAFSLTGPGGPAQLGDPVPVRGASPTHLTLAGERLFTANYASASVGSLPVRADGSLGGSAQEPVRHRGSGPDPARQTEPHPHSVVADPSGRWLLSADLGTDSVWVHALGEDGVRAHHETRLRAGSGPRHLVFHPGGTRAYVVNELAPTVTVCRWDARTGTLEPYGETATVPRPAGERRRDGRQEAPQQGPDYPSGLVSSADGRFLWAANRGHDSIAVLATDETGDALELVTTVPCGGHWPRALALHPSGRWLYAANERSGDVTWFGLDPLNGTPHRAGSLAAPAASCVVFR